ncbi:hypothetical protein Tco_1251951, partial [Tanacetum coccineum]
MLAIQAAEGEDEAVYEEWDDKVERATTTAASLDADQATESGELGCRLVANKEDDEENLNDSSKQGRKIDEIDQDPNITLVQHDAEIQGRHRQEIEFETEVYTAEDVS